MQPIWSEPFKIKSFDINTTGKLKLSSLFEYLQEVAGNHAENIEVGYDQLQEKNLFWVLSRMKLNIERLPKWNETIEIATWPKGIDKLFAIRDFEIFDSAKNLIISATSSWLLIDSIKHRLHKIEELQIPIPDNEMRAAIKEFPDKIISIEGNSISHLHSIKYSELDILQHVNNSQYISWIYDCYQPEFLNSNALKSIQINYLDEAKFLDKLEIKLIMADKTHYIEGLKSNGNKSFQALLEWGY